MNTYMSSASTYVTVLFRSHICIRNIVCSLSVVRYGLYVYIHTCKHMLCSTQHTFTKSSTSDMSLTSIDILKMRKRFLSIPKTRSIVLRTDSHLPPDAQQ